MTLQARFTLLADYNQWMNAKVYEAAAQLDEAELTRDRGAFFGSILGTLNHILVADTIWLQRFAKHPRCHTLLQQVSELPSPAGLDQMLFDDLAELARQRSWMDRQIIDWVQALTDDDLELVLSYHNTKGVAAGKRFSSLMLHLFNHQTHHRGQVTTLLSQAGVDVGVTDLLALIPDEGDL
ncbi:DinB family protein [Halopseudomonas nanhaiensis]|uniref:DinB family protein n=1 Tax=Halopseudomonas nanhaiensis TaxID=2830842 RepID=UPI001CBAFB2A|nr:DinB family protein [Halopseudomonas nanhaiensis]UAW98565.1 DinB family protein [Halopseudomonas nanhaiensis]